MKLIIDIDKELYEAYKGKPPMLGDAGMDMIAQAIANGTPYNPTDENDCKGCCHYTCDGDIPYCELGHSIQKRCKKFRGADMRGDKYANR